MEITGRRKAAILISGLGPEIAARVYKHLGEQEIEQVTIELAQSESAFGTERLAVIEEFLELREANTYLNEGGIAYARTILEKAFGASKAKDILERLTTSLAPRPFDALRNADPTQLLTFLQGEHPQTIALVLAYIRPVPAALVLKGLPQDVAADVARRVATMERTTLASGQVLIEPEVEVAVWYASLDQPASRIIRLYRDHGTSEQYTLSSRPTSTSSGCPRASSPPTTSCCSSPCSPTTSCASSARRR